MYVHAVAGPKDGAELHETLRESKVQFATNDRFDRQQVGNRIYSKPYIPF